MVVARKGVRHAVTSWMTWAVFFVTRFLPFALGQVPGALGAAVTDMCTDMGRINLTTSMSTTILQSFGYYFY